MPSTRLFVGGVPVPAFGSRGWSLTAGVRAHSAGFEFDVATTETFRGRRTVEVEIDGSTFGPLYVTTLEAGSRPDTATVVLADRRFEWPRRHVARSYNVRRRTGDRRAVGDGSNLVETLQVVDDVAYAPWSLNNGKRWTAEDMARDVFEAIGVDAVTLPAGFGRGVAVQDAIFDYPGDAAVEYLFEFAGGGYTVTIDPDGSVVVIDLAQRDELAIMQAAGPVVHDAGFAAVADRRRFRPARVIVLFTREVELRFDFEEGAQSQTVDKSSASTTPRDGGDTVDDGRPPRDMVNVVPIPEVNLEVGNRKLALGTYLNIEEYLAALDGEQRSGVPRLTLEELRTYFHSPSFISHRYGVDDTGTEDPLWRRRLRALLQHWRVTFQLNTAWRARLKSLRATRVATIDPEKGTRAPATGYGAYLRKPTIGALYKSQQQAKSFGWRVGKYADDLADAEQAPVDVTVKDEELGIIRVYPLKDPFGSTEEMVPGEVAEQPAWSGNLGSILVWTMAKLADNYKLAVILTGIQGAPNDESRLEAVTVEARDADVNAGPSLGPAQYVRIDPGLTTARYRWDDTQAEQIESAFAGEGDYPSDLLINRDQIESVAKAIASSVYAQSLDRAEGRYPVGYNPRVVCRGSISTVDHVVAPDGTALTFITAAPPITAPSLWAYIPPGIANTLRRIAQP